MKTTLASDKFMLRLPAGMRAALAGFAAKHGRSMNAEVVYALARYIELGEASDQDQRFMLTEVGLSQISKRLLAGVDFLDQILFDVRDVDLDAFISSQRAQGLNLTRGEAIRRILRAYLNEQGYVKDPKKIPPA